MMRDRRPLPRRRLRRANIKLSVHRDRIAVDDFSVKLLRERKRKRSLTAGGRSKNDNQKWIRGGRAHVQRRLQSMFCQYRTRMSANSKKAITRSPAASDAYTAYCLSRAPRCRSATTFSDSGNGTPIL